MWDSEWNKIEFVNNIFYSQSKFLFFINGLLKRQDFQFSSAHNSYFCEQGPLFIFKEIHGQYQCHAFDDLALIQKEISDLTRSPFVQFMNDVHHRPIFKSIELGDFSLSSNDLLINRGMPVEGFYDFTGTAPDIGAIESTVTITSEVKSDPLVSLYPNPTQGKLWIDCADNLQLYSIEILLIDGRIVLPAYVRISESKYVISIPSSLSDGLYLLRFTTPFEKLYKSFSFLR
jgi:hypothetical protein